VNTQHMKRWRKECFHDIYVNGAKIFNSAFSAMLINCLTKGGDYGR